MGSIIHCFLKNCFETEDDRIPTNRDSYEEVNFMSTSMPPRLMAVDRLQISPILGNVENNNNSIRDETDCTNINSNVNGPSPLSRHEDKNNLHPQSNRIITLLSRFGLGANQYNSNQNEESIGVPAQREQGVSLIYPSSDSQIQNLDQSEDANALDRKPGNDEICKKCKVDPYCSSPLRVANEFHAKDSTHEVPNISLDEIVLPGSALQKEMSIKMKEDLIEQEDECVICMEPFDSSNPRMPTFCGCGQNQTYFHLPCLYQWIEQNKNCPVCWQRLRWEEF